MNILFRFCVSEKIFSKKKDNKTNEILLSQIQKCIPESANNNNLIIAYEPIWAIGTGITPTYDEISTIHIFIKNNLPKSMNFKVLYGGSVKASNSKNILNLKDVDGVLVGGSSLNIEEFNTIIES